MRCGIINWVPKFVKKTIGINLITHQNNHLDFCDSYNEHVFCSLSQQWHVQS